MSTSKKLSLSVVVALGLCSGELFAADKNGLGQIVGLGQPLTEADIKAWDITVLPDGTNLPPGSGTSAQGAKIYVDKKSLLFLNGTVLDYDTNLISQGFVFSNPNAKSTCGCGSSFGA